MAAFESWQHTVRRRRVGPGHLSRQPVQGEAAQPGPQQRGDLRPFLRRTASSGRSGRQHHHLLVRPWLVLVHPAARRRDQRRRGVVAVLHEDARQALAGAVPPRHHCAVSVAPRAPEEREPRLRRGGDRQLLLRVRPDAWARLSAARRRLRVHRSGVLVGRAAGDEQRLHGRRGRRHRPASPCGSAGCARPFRQGDETWPAGVLVVHLPGHQPDDARPVHVAEQPVAHEGGAAVAAGRRHFRQDADVGSATEIQARLLRGIDPQPEANGALRGCVASGSIVLSTNRGWLAPSERRRAVVVACEPGPSASSKDSSVRLLRPSLQRGELAVDDAADGEQLRAIEIARQRVAAVVLDPVVHADAILDRVPERRLARMRVLAHLQRHPLLVGILVDEHRRRHLVAGDQPAADQRKAERIEIGRAHGEAQPLRQPVDQPLLFGRPDFDGAIHVRRVEHMRERDLPRERGRRAFALQVEVAAEPAERRCRRAAKPLRRR